MSTKTNLRASRDFHLTGVGTVRAGQEFSATPTQAQFLMQRGRAVQADRGPTRTQATGPKATQAAAGPQETADMLPAEVKELGNGWYEYNGQKIHGRKALDEALAGK